MRPCYIAGVGRWSSDSTLSLSLQLAYLYVEARRREAALKSSGAAGAAVQWRLRLLSYVESAEDVVVRQRRSIATFIFHLLEYLELILPNQATDGQTFLSNLYAKTIILPRQARDKHRENSKDDGGRTNVLKLLHYSLNGQEAERLLAETLQ